MNEWMDRQTRICDWEQWIKYWIRLILKPRKTITFEEKREIGVELFPLAKFQDLVE